jgi:short-subunit dehydrogenase
MGHFTDKVAVVMGAGSGIGRALACALKRRGARVFVASRTEARLAAVAKESEATGSVVLDVTDFEAVRSFLHDVAEKSSGIDFLFNNAGLGIVGEARDYGIAEWRKVIDVNLNGVVHGVAATYPQMATRRSGHIVNVSSLGGLIPVPALCSYVASKFGVVGLSLALRLEAKEHGVHVSCVCPGAVDTRMPDNAEWLFIDRKGFYDLHNAPMMSAEECAEITLRGVEKNRALILPGMATPAYWMHRHFPSVTTRSFSGLATKLRALRDRGAAALQS